MKNVVAQHKSGGEEMSTEIKMMNGIIRVGTGLVEKEPIECRIYCDKYHDTLSLHGMDMTISVSLSEIENLIGKARKK